MDSEKGYSARNSFEKLINAAHLFGTNLVTGFAGRLTDQPVEESIPKFKEVFTPLVKLAQEKGVKIAFENCSMGGDWNRGDWNIAFSSKIWEMMFEAVPYDNIGLQWEPCHQMVQLIDPIPQLRKWTNKIFAVHGKDATVAWDVIKENGIFGKDPFVWHRTPGFGDSNWTDIISILRMSGFKGSIDIEGWHDPVYRGEMEYTGQVHALRYLKNCRGGDWVPNLEKDD
jgi:sugar phosphate isomerase/epimerase